MTLQTTGLAADETRIAGPRWPYSVTVMIVHMPMA